MPAEDILADIGGDQADPLELEHVLLSHFHRSTHPANDRVLYGDDQNRPAAELHYDAGAGRPSALRPGPAFRAEDRDELRRIVHEQLLAEGPVKIGRAIMFTAVPTVGGFRFRDEFQILPLPPEAPRPQFLVGDHPLVLEFAFPSSANPMVNNLRRGKLEREIQLLCSLLLVPALRAQSLFALFHWVHEPTTADGNLVSSFRQGGYAWPGARFQDDAFSPLAEYPPLGEVDPQTYYGRQGVSATQTLEIPSTFTESLELVRALSNHDRERFLRACYWYQQSSATWLISRSISFEALVCAIEALMPDQQPGDPCQECGRPQGEGLTKIFTDFVDRFVPEIPRQQRRNFYRLRSAISHGGKLLHADEVSWGFGLQQGAEDQEMRSLSAIVRAVLINWLHTPAPR